MENSTYDNEYVCSACFHDADIKKFIETKNKRPGCLFCKRNDAATASINDVFSYIRERIEENFTSNNMVGHFPVEGVKFNESTSWGRYTSEQLLSHVINIELPRDENKHLFTAICNDALGKRNWCSLEYGSISRDKELLILWEMFTINVKHCRRFSLEKSITDNEYSPLFVFNAIADYIKSLIRTIPTGRLIFRVRKSESGEKFDHVDQLGPPPPHTATQSNRMNPPGIPYFYGAETEEIARMETRVKAGDAISIGVFEVKKQINVIDLADVPNKVGYFANVSLDHRQSIKFMHSFSEEISKPITGDDRTHLDYIPTQVIAELIRDKLGVHGIRYKSSHDASGANIVLFISSNNIEGGTKRGIYPEEVLNKIFAPLEVLRLKKVIHFAGSADNKTIRQEGSMTEGDAAACPSSR